jgi:hypothetical protein
MARLFMLLFLAQVVLAVSALISCLSAEDGDVRVLPRLAWVLVILFIPLIGPIAWFVAGRTAAGTWPRGAWWPDRKRYRPLAPDDDPDFLRSIGTEQAKKDREMFGRWEEDLRRREDQTRRPGTGDPPREDNRPDG